MPRTLVAANGVELYAGKNHCQHFSKKIFSSPFFPVFPNIFPIFLPPPLPRTKIFSPRRTLFPPLSPPPLPPKSNSSLVENIEIFEKIDNIDHPCTLPPPPVRPAPFPPLSRPRPAPLPQIFPAFPRKSSPSRNHRNHRKIPRKNPNSTSPPRPPDRWPSASHLPLDPPLFANSVRPPPRLPRPFFSKFAVKHHLTPSSGRGDVATRQQGRVRAITASSITSPRPGSAISRRSLLGGCGFQSRFAPSGRGWRSAGGKTCPS